MKKRIILKPTDEISSGFTISYDAGKSLFDFSGEALAEYISAYLKPELNKILKD
jgi:vacuolar-type H+-ATPase subunit E/Vma4